MWGIEITLKQRSKMYFFFNARLVRNVQQYLLNDQFVETNLLNWSQLPVVNLGKLLAF